MMAMTRALGALLLAGALLAATPEKPRPKRGAIVDLEKNFDLAIEKVSPSDPMTVLSSTQGVYLEGYGAVFTAQVDLIITPQLNPFRRVMPEQDKARIRGRKVERLPALKQSMREALVNIAVALENMPSNEQVVLAVSVFHAHWEDTKGLPAQIVMQAERQKLLSRKDADSAIRTEEF